MKRELAKLAQVAALGLALVLTFSCSSGDDNGSGSGEINTPLKKDKINGFIQKGPFVKGSSITLFELDSDLVQTGKSFQSTIVDDKGFFEINSVQLVSPYVRLKTDGYYYNEVSGKKSTSPITLYAIADLTNKNSLNVNLLTHLEYEKVQKLVESGESFSQAKTQTQKEILKTFGIDGDFANSEDMSIFGSSEGSAILLAISILLQGERDEASLTDLLTDFNQSIKNSSEWSNMKKTELADWASVTDFEKIRANINGWGLPYEVPIFEKYIRKFWSDSYGLGECKPAHNGYSAKNANPLSANRNRNYVCNGSYWESIEETPSSSSDGSEISSSSNDGNSSSSSLEIPSSSSKNNEYVKILELNAAEINRDGIYVDLDGGVAYTRQEIERIGPNNPNGELINKIDVVFWQDRIQTRPNYNPSIHFGSMVRFNDFGGSFAMEYYNILTGPTQPTEDRLRTLQLNFERSPIVVIGRPNYLPNSGEAIRWENNDVIVVLTNDGHYFLITSLGPPFNRIAYLNPILPAP